MIAWVRPTISRPFAMKTNVKRMQNSEAQTYISGSCHLGPSLWLFFSPCRRSCLKIQREMWSYVLQGHKMAFTSPIWVSWEVLQMGL